MQWGYDHMIYLLRSLVAFLKCNLPSRWVWRSSTEGTVPSVNVKNGDASILKLMNAWVWINCSEWRADRLLLLIKIAVFYRLIWQCGLRYYRLAVLALLFFVLQTLPSPLMCTGREMPGFPRVGLHRSVSPQPPVRSYISTSPPIFYIWNCSVIFFPKLYLVDAAVEPAVPTFMWVAAEELLLVWPPTLA